jgi:hypothetical protein
MADCHPNLNKSASLTDRVNHITQQILDHDQEDDRRENDDVTRTDDCLARAYTNRRLAQKLCYWRTL